MNSAAHNDKAGAGPITGLLLLAWLGLPIFDRAGPSCRQAKEGIENLHEGHDRQRSCHCRDRAGDKGLKAGKEETRNDSGQDMAGSLGRSGRVEVDRM